MVCCLTTLCVPLCIPLDLLTPSQQDLVPLVKEGVKGFKCFMIESGVDEFPCVNEEEIVAGLEQLKVSFS